MKQIIFVSILVLATTQCKSQTTDLPLQDPTNESVQLGIPQLEFLSYWFNVSLADVLPAARNFSFTPTIPNNTVTFYYYVPNDNVILPFTSQNASTIMDLSLDLVIIIHGWLNNGRAYWIKDMAVDFYQTRKCNVISVDWSPISHGPYIPASTATQAIGAVVAQFLLDLNKQNSKTIDNVHLIGHSLGAQISGFTGKYVQSLSGNQEMVGWITGLDAAGPMFEIPLPRPIQYKLTRFDGVFVDLIHTNKLLAGVAFSYGHVDFFINRGGPIQPQCNENGIISAIFCSHLLSYDYYSESVLKPTKYMATQCNTVSEFDRGLCNNNTQIPLGEGVPKTARGTYFINDTSTESSFHPI